MALIFVRIYQLITQTIQVLLLQKITEIQYSAFSGTIVGSTCNNIPITKKDSNGKPIINMDSQTCISLGGIMSSGVCSGVPLIN